MDALQLLSLLIYRQINGGKAKVKSTYRLVGLILCDNVLSSVYQEEAAGEKNQRMYWWGAFLRNTPANSPRKFLEEVTGEKDVWTVIIVSATTNILQI